MERELSSFPLPPSQLSKLQDAGFITVSDVTDCKPSELSKELNISKEDALELLRCVRGEHDPSLPPPTSSASSQSVTAAKSAWEMLQEEQSLPNIVTFSEQLDGMLGGGVPLTKITELCGAPGIGKTQVCMQLAVDVQIPEAFGGLGGEAVYIDTEGSFLVQRLVDVARAMVSHCQEISQHEHIPEQVEALKILSLESVLGGVYCFRCHDYVELIATVHLLPEFLAKHPKVRLVIVDSIAFHFRHDFQDYSLRTRLLNGMAQSFIKMAVQSKLAVVLTNQMTTKISMDRSEESHLVPALGESWGHAATVRLILYWEGNQRRALLYKSPSRREMSVPYQITMGGIRDVNVGCQDDDDICEQPDGAGDADQRPMKRQRIDS